MRRILMGMVVVSVMGCDAGIDPVDEELGFDPTTIDGLVAEADAKAGPVAPPAAPTPATVKLVSWGNGDDVRSKVYCTGLTLLSGSSCYCNDDPQLMGTTNTVSGPNKCVLCSWSQWPDGTCELDTTNPVNVELTDNASVQYAYIDDGVETVIDASTPWQLDHSGGSCTCAPEDPTCSCTGGSLDFTVEKTLNDGTVLDESATIRLATPSLVVSAQGATQIQTRISCDTNVSHSGGVCSCDAYGLDGFLDGDDCVVCDWDDEQACSLGSSPTIHLQFTTSTSNGSPNYTYWTLHDGEMTAIPTTVPWVLSTESAGSCSCSGADCGCTSSTLAFEAASSGISPSPQTVRGTGNISTGG